jgi:hypothetical protein
MSGSAQSAKHDDDYSACTTDADIHRGQRLRALESGNFTFAIDRCRKFLIEASGANIANTVHSVGMVGYLYAKSVR